MKKTLKERIFSEEVEIVFAADLRWEVEKLLESHGISYDLGRRYWWGASSFYSCKIWTCGDIYPIRQFVEERVDEMRRELLKNVGE